MISRMAKDQIKEFRNAGLEPTFDDCILLNNLGLRVERGSGMCDFSACPRCAFLGDVILFEPTIAKRLWIDYARNLFADNPETQAYIIAFALGTSDNGLPDLHRKKEVEKAITDFRDSYLLNKTDTQILAAIDYCLTGVEPDLTLPGNEETKEVLDIPPELKSLAKQLLLEAGASKIDIDYAKHALQKDLERMIACAAMHSGSEIVKNENAQMAAKYYVAVAKIRERLTKDKENGEK